MISFPPLLILKYSYSWFFFHCSYWFHTFSSHSHGYLLFLWFAHFHPSINLLSYKSVKITFWLKKDITMSFFPSSFQTGFAMNQLMKSWLVYLQFPGWIIAAFGGHFLPLCFVENLLQTWQLLKSCALFSQLVIFHLYSGIALGYLFRLKINMLLLFLKTLQTLTPTYWRNFDFCLCTCS